QKSVTPPAPSSRPPSSLGPPSKAASDAPGVGVANVALGLAWPSEGRSAATAVAAATPARRGARATISAAATRAILADIAQPAVRVGVDVIRTVTSLAP